MCAYTTEYYSDLKMRISCYWRQHGWTLSALLLNEVSETERQIPYDFTSMCNLKRKKGQIPNSDKKSITWLPGAGGRKGSRNWRKVISPAHILLVIKELGG